eukprot:CAMPEP_0170072340 /NCGR_PEP_ID=MMETSP0019_2-20121128/10006_1 /TAXON_ID=98059 /ORGANISM="Dinobryon sp., Strain UTEXLB2267" /LENGTH=88 /DNA_ID=CAMNT_0010281269 /DNA_START=254 /DNA_END=520 /DNA_ORIENTATION=-
MTLSTDWVAMWAGADIYNVALDGQLEDKNGPFAGPFYRRLDDCLVVVRPKVMALKSRFEQLEHQIDICMNTFGESLKEVGEGACHLGV